MRVEISGYPKVVMVDVVEEVMQRYGVPHQVTEWVIPRLQNVLDYTVNKFREDRYVEVKIHKDDIINMDHTLSEIILPMLEKYHLLTLSKGPYFMVDDDDVPISMKADEYDVRCVYVLDKIIQAFKLHRTRDIWEASYYASGDMHGLAEENEHIQEGFNLFGKHYGDFWL